MKKETIKARCHFGADSEKVVQKIIDKININVVKDN